MENNNQEGASVTDSKKRRENVVVWVGIIVIIILLLGLGLSINLLKQQTKITGKAYTGSSGKVELANSYIFASPLKARAGGVEKIRLSVFVLDSQGKGVMGKPVSLDLGNVSLVVDSLKPTTDELGRAVFDISAATSGLYVIQASVEGKSLPQKISITFE